MQLLTRIGEEILATGLAAAPFLLLGLAAAGLIHVLIPEATIARWLGRPGLGTALRAALVGIPLPVCSCGVVPIAVELRRRGASRPATLSFLVTTPESGVDSILFTGALMGPVMAIARPVAALITAMVGAVLALVTLGEDGERRDAPAGPRGDGAASPAGAAHAGHEADCGCEHPAAAAQPPGPENGSFWTRRARPALRYGFVELLDELAFWLVLGVVLAGILAAALPADLEALGLGSGFGTMLLMLVVGVPIYLCASASTPVAAALLAKGLGPGAALVFLLAGPATNAASLILLGKTLGRRFVLVYLASVVLGALACGLLLELVLSTVGAEWSIRGMAGQGETAGLLAWASLLILVGLLVWRFASGAWGRGWRELRGSLRALVTLGRGALASRTTVAPERKIAGTRSVSFHEGEAGETTSGGGSGIEPLERRDR